MAIVDRVRKAVNAFLSNEPGAQSVSYGGGTSYSQISPSLPRRGYYNEKTIITSICTRISIDAADVLFRHVKLDAAGRYKEDVDSNFNSCLNFEANLDQAPRAFKQDIVMSLLDDGVTVIVPVDTIVDSQNKEIIDIFSMRVGRVKQWHPSHVRVEAYNEATGLRQEILLNKRRAAIIENPLYAVMNEPNSTLQRLIRKLSLLDAVDEQSSSGKLDVIIQLPYVVKSPARKEQAEQRRTDIELQLSGSKYGIAYVDGTEKITQLNRPAENNLLKTVDYLTNMLYGQLGITEDVMNGTADDKTMLNYHNRTIKPIIDSIVEAMQRAFIGPDRFNKDERVLYFIDPFKLVTVKDLAEIADKFTRNEVLTTNEIRGFVGIPPSNDPKADLLQNSNMPQPGAVVYVNKDMENGTGTVNGRENSNGQKAVANGRQNS